jgi:hypothetical protein
MPGHRSGRRDQPPGSQAQRHVPLEQRPRLRGGAATRRGSAPGRGQQAVGRRWAERLQLRSHLLREREVPVPFERRHQLRQERDQALGADAVRRLPGDPEGGLHCRAVARGPRPRDRRGGGRRMTEHPDGVLAGVAGGGDELVQDNRLLGMAGRQRAVGGLGKEFALRRETHP